MYKCIRHTVMYRKNTRKEVTIMKKSKIARWITAGFTAFTFLFALIIPMGGGVLFGNIDGSESVSHVQAAETTYANNIVTYPNGTNELGCFPDGYSYVFTDKTKITSFRSRITDSDLTTVTVDSSLPVGNQKNPYVIADTDDWEKFAKKVITTNSNGLNQYFVLASDLDFSGVAFHPVYYFKGTFYGLGHSLKNISVSTWQSYISNTTLTNMAAASYGYGVFGGVGGATITDLIVEDFQYKDMPQLS